jgi:hypothetical protein
VATKNNYFYFVFNVTGGEKKSGDSSKYEPLPSPGQMSDESTLEKLNTCLKGSAFLAGPELTQVQRV